MSTMKAVRIHENGGSEVLKCEDVPVPTIAAGQVLVKIHRAGVNFIDTYQRTGLYKIPLPAILGREGSGVISQVGENVNGWKEGDRVCFCAGGTYAEYAAVGASQLASVPDSVDMDTAAALMLQGRTAHYLTRSVYKVGPTDTVLVHAAAGGTGAIVVQMCKKFGAKVIGTCSTEEKAKLARESGCDEVILYSQVDFVEEVKRITDGKKCNVVYDSVGKSTWEGSLDCVKPRGYMVFFGNASGPVPPVAPLTLCDKGSIFMTRCKLGDYMLTPEEAKARADDVFEWAASGDVKFRVTKQIPLEKAGESHDLLESRGTTGKLVLKICD